MLEQSTQVHPPVLAPTKEWGKARLATFTVGQDANCIDPDYEADSAFRIAVLRARSVLAAVHFNADALGARLMHLNGGVDLRVLLVGDKHTLAQAELDFPEMYQRFAPSDVLGKGFGRGFMPVVVGSKDWRTNFGWFAILNPTGQDHYPFYTYLRSSLQWLKSHPDSAASIVKARGLTKCSAGSAKVVDIVLVALRVKS